MSKRVAIVGIGWAGFRSTTPDISYREMIFEAAAKCYEDAGGIHPQEIDAFVASSEDFMEGISIADEYVPDQLGAVLKPVQSITGDGLQGLAGHNKSDRQLDLWRPRPIQGFNLLLNVAAYATDPPISAPAGKPLFYCRAGDGRYLRDRDNPLNARRGGQTVSPFQDYYGQDHTEDVLEARCPCLGN